MLRPKTVTYRELRNKHGNGITLVWQRWCNLLGFDPDPTVTVAMRIAPVVEDPSVSAPEQTGGPAGGPKRPPFDAAANRVVGVDPVVPNPVEPNPVEEETE